MSKEINIFGYGTGLAASVPGCQMGPNLLQQQKAVIQNVFTQLGNQHINFCWHEFLQLQGAVADDAKDVDKFSLIADICQRLATQIEQAVSQQKFFLALGGDHSMAIGTWSGAHQVLNAYGNIGLIWFDAHLDSHTPQTSFSGSIHGMPVAALLGHGDERLISILNSQPKILPQHLCLIGIRSYEPAEKKLLERLGVRIFYMKEVQQRGLSAVLQEALSIAKTNTVAYGISIDIDAIDPKDAPGIGSPEPGGLLANDLIDQLSGIIADPKLLGVEIAEFNPRFDNDNKTLQLIFKLVQSIINTS